MHLEEQGRALPFLKPPINISKDPDCHWCCGILDVYQAMQKNCIPVSRLMHRKVCFARVAHYRNKIPV